MMRIGQLAAEAGVSVDTVRYYERRGLLSEPARSPTSGYRSYPLATIRVIRFIRRAQDLGFTLDEIGELLALRDVGRRNRREVQSIARAKVAAIDEKLSRLESMRSALGSLLDACTCGGRSLSCPILEALDDPSAGGGV